MPNCVNNQNLVLVIIHVKFFFCCKILIVVNYVRVNQEMTYYFYGKGAKNCNEGPQFWNFAYIFVLCLPPPILFLSCLSVRHTVCQCNSSETTEQNFMCILPGNFDRMNLWELCPFELRNFPKFTTEAACQHNSSETTEQNFMKLGW